MARFFTRSYVGLCAPLESARADSDPSEQADDAGDE